ncbi:MAG TPA: VOC family protein [Edaphobacter sp.]|nr:VOC family protein [Edaphobacter sp.]
MQIQPYLFFKGDCEEAFKFYERVLKGKIAALLPYAGSPAEQQISPECRVNILHACLTVGDAVFLASDAPPERYTPPAGFSVNLQINEIPEAERVFHELSAGGKVTMAIQQTFWANRFGMFTDRFGIPWMINCNEPSA